MEKFKSTLLAISAVASLFSSEVMAEQPVAPQIRSIQSGARLAMANIDPLGEFIENIEKKAQNRQETKASLQSSDSFSSAYFRIQRMIENLPSPLYEERSRIAALSIRIEQLVQQGKVANTYPWWFLLDIQKWRELGISASDLDRELSRWGNNFLPES